MGRAQDAASAHLLKQTNVQDWERGIQQVKESQEPAFIQGLQEWGDLTTLAGCCRVATWDRLQQGWADTGCWHFEMCGASEALQADGENEPLECSRTA